MQNCFIRRKYRRYLLTMKFTYNQYNYESGYHRIPSKIHNFSHQHYKNSGECFWNVNIKNKCYYYQSGKYLYYFFYILLDFIYFFFSSPSLLVLFLYIKKIYFFLFCKLLKTCLIFGLRSSFVFYILSHQRVFFNNFYIFIFFIWF